MTVTALNEGVVFTTPEGHAITLLAPCDDKEGGYWYCVTHAMAFPNNFAKSLHIDKGQHAMAWACHTHGFEAAGPQA